MLDTTAKDISKINLGLDEGEMQNCLTASSCKGRFYLLKRESKKDTDLSRM